MSNTHMNEEKWNVMTKEERYDFLTILDYHIAVKNLASISKWSDIPKYLTANINFRIDDTQVPSTE